MIGGGGSRDLMLLSLVQCPPGYRLDLSGRHCRDVDECAERAGRVCAHGSCTNNAGSFHCACPEGFALSPGRDTCVDIDECARTPGLCGPGGTCVNTAGGHRCVCGPGWQLGAAGDCQD